MPAESAWQSAMHAVVETAASINGMAVSTAFLLPQVSIKCNVADELEQVSP